MLDFDELFADDGVDTVAATANLGSRLRSGAEELQFTMQRGFHAKNVK